MDSNGQIGLLIGRSRISPLDYTFWSSRHRTPSYDFPHDSPSRVPVLFPLPILALCSCRSLSVLRPSWSGPNFVRLYHSNLYSVLTHQLAIHEDCCTVRRTVQLCIVPSYLLHSTPRLSARKKAHSLNTHLCKVHTQSCLMWSGE